MPGQKQKYDQSLVMRLARQLRTINRRLAVTTVPDEVVALNMERDDILNTLQRVPARNLNDLRLKFACSLRAHVAVTTATPELGVIRSIARDLRNFKNKR